MSAYQVCPVARMEKLLLPTDGSMASEGAAREAINLAKTCGSKLYIISVVEIPAFGGEFVETLPKMIEKLETDARGLLESLKERAGKEGVSCEALIYQGVEPYKYIVDEAAKNNVEMIIMGGRGKTGLERVMMGSVTAKVIGHAPCKVMVVPKDAKLTLEKILIATDGSIYSELASREAISIAKRSGGSLVVLSVAKRDENLLVAKESVDMVRKVAEKEGIKVEALTLKGMPHEVIVNTAAQKKAGLIVIGSYGRTGIERLLMGSVTERVIGHSGCAVLVVKKI
ncbi:MAG: universal stress protein [Nitrospirae bacterium]|nr:universal stress protein [Nitrospirota bacterium]